MKIQRAYKTELDLNNKQRTACLRHAGAARRAYNWGLEQKQKAYQAWVDGGKRGACKTPTAIDLHRELNKLKKLSIENGGFPWMYEVSKCAPQEALRNLDVAYQNFFRRCKSGVKYKGFPRFKSRKRGIGSFTLTGSIKATETRIKLPRLGSLRLYEHGYLPITNAKVLSATVSEKAGRWFVSIQVEQEIFNVALEAGTVGVDVGSRNLATTSDGEVFENPRALKKTTARLRLLQKSVSRKPKGSNNRKKAVAKVAKQHYRISCIRKDALHKCSDSITKSASVIVLENLNVAGMMKNHKLARSVADASMAELHRQIKYKATWHDVQIVLADRWFPSTKTCSTCGFINKAVVLGVDSWTCPACGTIHDRDINAAINLKKLAGSSPVAACCPGSSGLVRKNQVKLLVGQEPDAVESVHG